MSPQSSSLFQPVGSVLGHDENIYPTQKGNALGEPRDFDQKVDCEAKLLVDHVKSDNCVLAAMRRAGVPLTRENYLEWAYPGQLDCDELDPELEAELPVQFQREESQRADVERQNPVAKPNPRTTDRGNVEETSENRETRTISSL
jgi:hypothetical protein